ncbi:MAG: hypothetical protein CBC02_009735 [Flavobacteriaceae bacterium TMED42]|nr:MAG: hypothetical protein CBC02_009735 [Flavobacteriaceae bacterium TMED42]|tara:strand:- start:574 stop:903 length:330 start_codon:yes stop_codon:yes gene_type:complete
MGNKRIPKKFKTSWGREYVIYVTDTSDATENDEPSSETTITSEINNVKMKNIILLIIAIGTIALCINFKSEQRSSSFESGTTPYEHFPDAYENSSFNPQNGYIGNTYER